MRLEKISRRLLESQCRHSSLLLLLLLPPIAAPSSRIRDYPEHNEENAADDSRVVRLACYLRFDTSESRIIRAREEARSPLPAIFLAFLTSRNNISAVALRSSVLRVFEVDRTALYAGVLHLAFTFAIASTVRQSPISSWSLFPAAFAFPRQA